jgi:uncharacterized membrane protein
MAMMILGLCLWIGVHLFPTVAPQSRERMISRLGNGPYQGLFALLVFSGLLLIIFGWRNTLPTQIYTPILALRHPAMLLVVIAIILMVAASLPNRIKRYIRHPQLTGVLLWAIAHLLMNGDSRSVLVFLSLAIWSAVSMLMINRRDGTWVKPEPPRNWVWDIAVVVIGLILSVLIVRFHQYLSGVPLVT